MVCDSTTQSSPPTLRRQIMFIGQCRKRPECLEGKLIASHRRLARDMVCVWCVGERERRCECECVCVREREGESVSVFVRETKRKRKKPVEKCIGRWEKKKRIYVVSKFSCGQETRPVLGTYPILQELDGTL